MRGLIANQTLAMFKFCFEVALPYLHGPRLKALRAYICDGDSQLCDALESSSLPDGPMPFAKGLRCGWHLIDRAIIRVFGNGNKHWQKCLSRAFWMWSQIETFDDCANFHSWLNRDFFNAKCIKDDMSAQDEEQFPSFIASLWVTRAHWCRAFNMELGAFDTRTSTFVESQNAVLTEDVKVSASMNIRTMVQTESRVHQTKQRRLEHANFQRKIRPLSDTSGDHDESLELARKFLCPKPLKRMTRQVHLAKSCLRSSDTKYSVCTSDLHECTICSATLLTKQKELLLSKGGIRLHLRVFMDECINKKVRFEDMEFSFVDLLKSAPRRKLTRVVTCHPHEGYILMRCSCGHGMRHLSLCLHCSMVIQKVSDYRCCGCEEENLHIRHCELYAGLEDITKIHRTADDWVGIRCRHVTLDSIKEKFVSSNADNDASEEDGDESPSRPNHDHDTRRRREEDDADAVFQASKMERLHTARNKYYELQRIVQEPRNEEEFERRMQILDEILMEGKRRLPAAVGGGSARATHTAADATRRKSRRMAPLATPVSSSSLYTTIVISDSDDARDLQQDGASSSE
jgi:hypothetical protein